MVNLWNAYNIKENVCYYWKIGLCKIWIQNIADEWLVAIERISEEEDTIIAQHGEKPENLTWNRYIYKSELNIIRFVPCLPDRPIVVDPELPIRILPDNSALFFVSIPSWIRIFTGTQGKIMLLEVPAEVLSNTWFGDPMEGELCYSFKTLARRSLKDINPRPHRIYCPVNVYNGATVPLEFQKLCIHVENLRVYKGKELLLTNEIDIIFLGDDQPSQIKLSGRKPSIDKDCKLICEARMPSKGSLLKRSFSLLKYFTNF